MTQPKMTRPDLKIEIAIGEETRTVKYTYGLANDIQRLVPDFGSVISDIIGDPGIRDYIVRRALTDKKGVVTNEDQLISFEELDDIDPDEVLRLLDWISSHLCHFFMNSAANIRRQATAFSSELGLSNPSTTGSEDSALTTPSAGPSA